MLGGLLRGKKQVLARFQLGGHSPTVLAGAARPQLWPSDGFAICAVSRHLHFIGAEGCSSLSRNSVNRKSRAMFRASLS